MVSIRKSLDPVSGGLRNRFGATQPKGQLVMGRGIALAAKKRVPNIAKVLGDRINHLRNYGLVIWKRRQSVAAFQVKRHFKAVASLELIEMSAKQLASLAEKYPDARFRYAQRLLNPTTEL